jgi:hypothetical protein
MSHETQTSGIGAQAALRSILNLQTKGHAGKLSGMPFFRFTPFTNP